MLRTLLALSFVLFLAGCSDEQQIATQTPQASGQTEHLAAAHAVQPQAAQLGLLFFLDPNGNPCKMQESILLGMQNELKKKVSLRYIKTTVPAQRNSFYEYGIRALPTLLLVDGSGQEIRRLTPGVQKAAAIRALIKSPAKP